jgi:hypothetical protein
MHKHRAIIERKDENAAHIEINVTLQIPVENIAETGRADRTYDIGNAFRFTHMHGHVSPITFGISTAHFRGTRLSTQRSRVRHEANHGEVFMKCGQAPKEEKCLEDYLGK